MSTYNSPVLHNGSLNSVVNTSDLTTYNTTSTLNLATADSRYLKLSGGVLTGALTLPNENVTSETITTTLTTPSITLSGGTASQTSAQIGYYKNVTLAITGGSISNGTVSSPSYNVISIPAGVWIVSYYHTITCTASITFSQIVHGLTYSSSGVYNNQMANSSTDTETLASGSKYISNTYVMRHSSTTNVYAPLTIAYTTAGTPTINFGISAVRLA